MPFPRALLLLAPLVASTAYAQTVPRQTLSKPQVELPESFDNVVGLRELSDGRVLVADRVAKAIWLVDVAKGTQRRIGREGSGPGEFQLPTALIALPADTTILVDALQSRLLVINPDGSAGAQLRLPDNLSALNGLRAADSRGLLYAGGGPIRFGGPGDLQTAPTGLRADTIPVFRWNRKTNALDTLATIQGPLRDLRINRTGSNVNVMIRQQPFSAQDDWAVATDGRVAIIRHQPYRVQWVGASTVTGPAVQWQPVKVTKADTDLIEAAQRNPANRIAVTRGGPSGGGAGSRPQTPTPSANVYPENKPPFVERTAIVSPKGELWVQRSVAAGQPTVYDIFDAKGVLTRQVALTPRSRVVGFGKSGVYVARLDEDDLQWVARFSY